MPIKPLRISAYTTVNALGRGIDASLWALQQGHGGLRPCDFEDVNLDTWIGRVEGLEDEPLRDEFKRFDCRNNRLARIGLLQDGFGQAVTAARARYGADRIGVFIGTSTAGILETEQAYRKRDPVTGKLPSELSYQHTHDIFAVSQFSRLFLRLEGVAAGISTACSSSAKVFSTAYRYMQTGLCDAAVVGGVDSLCLTTLYGFNALQLTSSRPCRPWDVERDGLSLGEAAGFALLEWPQTGENGVALLGYGESSDAYHMSSAHPEGLGAMLAMEQALDRAGLEPARLDYINLHGTATASNDVAEDKAVIQVCGKDLPCSSTKGWTGHTLGAAGITEAVFSCLCIEHGFIPASFNTERLDPALSAAIVQDTRTQAVATVMSNSFGFGGSNCSLLFGTL